MDLLYSLSVVLIIIVLYVFLPEKKYDSYLYFMRRIKENLRSKNKETKP